MLTLTISGNLKSDVSDGPKLEPIITCHLGFIAKILQIYHSSLAKFYEILLITDSYKFV